MNKQKKYIEYVIENITKGIDFFWSDKCKKRQ